MGAGPVLAVFQAFGPALIRVSTKLVNYGILSIKWVNILYLNLEINLKGQVS